MWPEVIGFSLRRVFEDKRKRSFKFSVFVVRLLLGLVFLYASVDKIIYPAAFAEVVHNYRLLPDFLINITAIVLPWIEFLLGLLLISGLWLPGVSFLSTLLMASFFAAIVFNAVRGLDVQCGCFTLSTDHNAQTRMAWYIIRDLLFVILSVYLFFCVVQIQLAEKADTK